MSSRPTSPNQSRCGAARSDRLSGALLRPMHLWQARLCAELNGQLAERERQELAERERKVCPNRQPAPTLPPSPPHSPACVEALEFGQSLAYEWHTLSEHRRHTESATKSSQLSRPFALRILQLCSAKPVRCSPIGLSALQCDQGTSAAGQTRRARAAEPRLRAATAHRACSIARAARRSRRSPRCAAQV